MLPKEFSPASRIVSMKKLVLELEADSTSVVTLRVKPDRRQLDLPAQHERRVAWRQMDSVHQD